MTSEINSAEFFGIGPDDPGAKTFDTDFPTSGLPVVDYDRADWEMGTAQQGGEVKFPETAEEEQDRINTWLKKKYGGDEAASDIQQTYDDLRDRQVSDPYGAVENE